jgi:hypothetical protein
MPLGNRVLGLLVYGLVGPLLCLLVGGIVPLILLGIVFTAFPGIEKSSSGLPAILCMVVAGAIGLAVLVGMARLMIRMYRRQAGGEVRIWPDRLELTGAPRQATVTFGQLSELEYAAIRSKDRPELVLRSEEGTRLELVHPWPVKEIFEHLRVQAVPIQVRRMKELLHRGDALVFRERTRRTWMSFLVGSAFTAGGIAFSVGLLLGRKSGEPVPWIALVRVMIPTLFIGVAGILWGIRLLGNGMVVSRTGLRPIGRDFGGETPWGDITRMTLSPKEMILGGAALESPYRLSRDAPNSSALAALASEMTPLEKEEVP